MPEISSPNKALPEGVTEEELYDGPVLGTPPENVVPLKPNPVMPTAAEMAAPIPEPPIPTDTVWRGSSRVHAPEVSPIRELKTSYPAVLTAALDVLSARLLGLLAVIAACLIWGFAVYDPTPLRIAAASLFSITALLPLIVLYWKAGVTGGGG